MAPFQEDTCTWHCLPVKDGGNLQKNKENRKSDLVHFEPRFVRRFGSSLAILGLSEKRLASRLNARDTVSFIRNLDDIDQISVMPLLEQCRVSRWMK
jgi:hypothetical protein